MAYAHKDLDNDGKDVLDFVEIHRSAGTVANAKYREKYGTDKDGDPDYETGNERHDFWLTAFHARWTKLILNPQQN